MTRESKNKQRKKYTLQLRPYVGTALSELIDYLQSVDKAIAKSKIEDILLAALLPVARLHSGKYTQEQLRLTCLESCESLDKYSSFLRQILMISRSEDDFQSEQKTLSSDSKFQANDSHLNAQLPKKQINGQGSAADIDLVFGDD